MIRWYVKQAARATGFACGALAALYFLLLAFEHLR